VVRGVICSSWKVLYTVLLALISVSKLIKELAHLASPPFSFILTFSSAMKWTRRPAPQSFYH
jgi:hypothetical protein